MNWFDRLCRAFSPAAPVSPVSPVSPDPSETRSVDLEQEVERLQSELARAVQARKQASAAQGAIHRRAEALRADWPEIWKRYFTTEGEAARLQSKEKPKC